MTLTPKQVVQRSDEPLTPDEMARLTSHMSPHDLSLFHRAVSAAHAQGRARGLGEAVGVCSAFKSKTLAAQSGNPAELSNVMLRQVAELGHGECSAAIEQLRACGSAATPG